MKIKAIKIRQGKQDFYVVGMKAKELLDVVQVDKFLSEHPDGYQRTLSETRANAFGRFLNSGGASPSSILVNVRDADIIEEENNYISIPDNAPLWVVDGQHRVGGLQFAVEKDPSHYDLEFPVIIMNEPSNYLEAKEFVTINKTQKGVRTDLAERFLMRAVKEEGREKLFELRESGVMQTILKNVEWVPKAIEIVDILNNDKESLWYGRIRLPNADTAGTIVSQKSFTDSLQPILKETFFSGKQPPQIASALRNYWKAISELCSDAIQNPKEHVIQKTTGVFVLHKIFPRVTEICRDEKGNKILTKERIKSVLHEMPFMDSEYWGTNGTAGRRGTSQKAFSSLVLEALESLEEIEPAEGTDLIT